MVEAFNQGPGSLISALYDQLRIGQTIDEMVRWDPVQCRLSPGTRIKALVINILGRQRPLYRLAEFYEHMDIEKLFGKGIHYLDNPFGYCNQLWSATPSFSSRLIR